MKQYTLPIKHNIHYNPHDFIFSSCNNSLKSIIEHFPEQYGIKPYPKIVMIEGPHKSGKTHFLYLFQSISQGKFIEPKPEYYISLTCGYNFIERNEEDNKKELHT